MTVPVQADHALAVVRRQHISIAKAIWIWLFYAIANRLPDTPMPLSRVCGAFRVFLFRRFVKRAGVDIRVHANIDVGSGVNIEIGDRSSINKRCWIANDTVIGSDVMMGPEIVILSGSHVFSRTDIPMTMQGAEHRRPVHVGDDVWIGTRSILLPGVSIGSHAIVGAGSVVTHDVAEWSIVAGNPARVIGDRRVQDAG